MTYKYSKENFDKLVVTLSIYADPESWWCGNGMIEGELVGFHDSIDCGDCRDVAGKKQVGGAIARKTLAEIKSEEENDE